MTSRKQNVEYNKTSIVSKGYCRTRYNMKMFRHGISVPNVKKLKEMYSNIRRYYIILTQGSISLRAWTTDKGS